MHPEITHYSPTTGIIKSISSLFHALDIYTDLDLALHFYNYGLEQKQGEHYHIGFIWIILAVFGPYIL